jgi:hypothetical protein
VDEGRGRGPTSPNNNTTVFANQPMKFQWQWHGDGTPPGDGYKPVPGGGGRCSTTSEGGSCWGWVCAAGGYGINHERRYFSIMIKKTSDLEWVEVCKVKDIPDGDLSEGDPKTSCDFTPTSAGQYEWKFRAGYDIPTAGGVYNNFLDSSTRALIVQAPPPAPINLQATCGGDGSQATVTWATAPTADHYAIRIQDQDALTPSGNCRPGTGDKCEDNVRTNSFTLQTSAGGSYTAWVHGLNPAGISPASQVVNFVCSPPPPTELSQVCSPAGNGVTLKWRAARGATTYDIRLDNTDATGGSGCSTQGEGDICQNNVSVQIGSDGYALYQASIKSADRFNWWVHARNSSGTSASVGVNHVYCPIAESSCSYDSQARLTDRFDNLIQDERVSMQGNLIKRTGQNQAVLATTFRNGVIGGSGTNFLSQEIQRALGTFNIVAPPIYRVESSFCNNSSSTLSQTGCPPSSPVKTQIGPLSLVCGAGVNYGWKVSCTSYQSRFKMLGPDGRPLSADWFRDYTFTTTSKIGNTIIGTNVIPSGGELLWNPQDLPLQYQGNVMKLGDEVETKLNLPPDWSIVGEVMEGCIDGECGSFDRTKQGIFNSKVVCGLNFTYGWKVDFTRGKTWDIKFQPTCPNGAVPNVKTRASVRRFTSSTRAPSDGWVVLGTETGAFTKQVISQAQDDRMYVKLENEDGSVDLEPFETYPQAARIEFLNQALNQRYSASWLRNELGSAEYTIKFRALNTWCQGQAAPIISPTPTVTPDTRPSVTPIIQVVTGPPISLSGAPTFTPYPSRTPTPTVILVPTLDFVQATLALPKNTPSATFPTNVSNRSQSISILTTAKDSYPSVVAPLSIVSTSLFDNDIFARGKTVLFSFEAGNDDVKIEKLGIYIHQKGAPDIPSDDPTKGWKLLSTSDCTDNRDCHKIEAEFLINIDKNKLADGEYEVVGIIWDHVNPQAAQHEGTTGYVAKAISSSITQTCEADEEKTYCLSDKLYLKVVIGNPMKSKVELPAKGNTGIKINK